MFEARSLILYAERRSFATPRAGRAFRLQRLRRAAAIALNFAFAIIFGGVPVRRSEFAERFIFQGAVQFRVSDSYRFINSDTISGSARTP